MFKSKFFQILLLFLMSGCASIVSKSKYPISLTSQPNKCEVTIVNRKGDLIYNGTTPTYVLLKAGQTFFKKAQYEVTFRKEGYESQTFPVKFGLDAWYFGNIIFGGGIGLLIIDPATGAMYRLKTEYIVATLEQADSIGQNSIDIYFLDEIPKEWKTQLVLIAESILLPKEAAAHFAR
ncbi:hypothetical protein [Ekhidna sp.]|uniref:hypothetical protein n=1 Tax=Ekhidna sp. TaxID=2608089 RepID=UPI0032EACD74